MRSLIRPLVATLLLGVAVNLAAQSPAAVTAFTHVNVLDVASGQVLQDRTVVVRNRRIEGIDSSGGATLPSDATVIDGSGKFLIPGLWDAHVHTRYAGIDHLRLLIAHGITSARDLGGGWEHLRELNGWIREIDDGKRIGPRLVAAGVVLDGPTSSWSHPALISTPEEGRAAVRRLKAEGAQYVKVYVRLSRPSFEAIVEEARRQQLPVGGHIVPSVGVFDAIVRGQSAIEHAADLLIPVSASEDEFRQAAQSGRPVGLRQVLASFSTDKATTLARHFYEQSARFVPTLSLYAHQLAVARADAAYVQSADLRFVPAAYLREWEAAKPLPVEATQARFDGAMRVTKHMVDANVEILAGTDVVKPFFVPGKSLHDELTLLVKAGFTPLQALRAATIAPANYLRLLDSGTIAPKQRADLVLLDADPLLDINNTRRIAGVMANGAYYSRRALDEMLRGVEREAANWKGAPTGQ